MKITVIGGAGVRTVIFINGLLDRYKKLNIDEVCLFDIDKDKLDIIYQLSKHVIARKDKDLELTRATDVREALKGADYVVTTLRVGGDQSRVQDEEIAIKYGVIGQETTGAGGFAMAIRTIPILIDYCQIISEVAPQAWIFNFTNPSGLVTQALHQKGFDKVIGICDAPSSTKFRVAKDLGIDEDDLYMEFFGLNHLSWVRSVRVKGEEIIDELIASDDFLEGVQEFSMFSKDVIRDIGFLPNEYLYYYYHRERALENILKSGAARGKTIALINEEMFQRLKEMDIEHNPEKALQIFLYHMQLRENSYMSIESGIQERQMEEEGSLEVPDGMGYAGVMLDCIEGMQSKEGKYLILSIPNQGCMDGLQDEDVVEVTCHVSREGIKPVRIHEVPEHCYLLMRTLKMYEKLTIQALEENSPQKAILALTYHPLVQSYSLAKILVKEYSILYNVFDM